MNNSAQGPNIGPAKKGMSGGKIALIVVAVLFALTAGTCATCMCVGGSSAKVVMDQKADAITGAKKDYVGTWKGGDQLLVITPDSVKNKDGSFTLSGNLEGFRGNDIVYMGNSVVEVQTPPHEEGGVWKMTANNTELTRQ